jgi:Cu-processing system ATP-binding protein
MLTFSDVSKYYGEIKALDGVSLELNEEEVFGLVGPNGSGKSTLLKIMLGILKPTSGKLLVNGTELTEKGWKEFRRTIGYMPERVSFYDNLTGMETLKLFARIKGGRLDNVKDFIDALLSPEALNRKVGGYSKGMRQRLNLLQSLLNNPSLLIMDEPSSGLDPIGTRQFYDLLDDVRTRRKLTVVLSSHILAEIEEKIDRVGVLRDGILKAVGTLEELYAGLNLPLKLRVTLSGKDGTIEEILRREGALNIVYKDGFIMADLPRENKLKTLSSVLGQEGLFSDFTIREPSLEEVFFGIH